MRSGVLLAEEPPQQLVERFHCNDLEEAFLALSHKQEGSPKDMVSSVFIIWNARLQPHLKTTSSNSVGIEFSKSKPTNKSAFRRRCEDIFENEISRNYV